MMCVRLVHVQTSFGFGVRVLTLEQHTCFVRCAAPTRNISVHRIQVGSDAVVAIPSFSIIRFFTQPIAIHPSPLPPTPSTKLSPNSLTYPISPAVASTTCHDMFRTAPSGMGRRAHPLGSVHPPEGGRRRARRSAQGHQGQFSEHAGAAISVLPPRRQGPCSRQVHPRGHGCRVRRDGKGSRQGVRLQGTVVLCSGSLMPCVSFCLCSN